MNLRSILLALTPLLFICNNIAANDDSAFIANICRFSPQDSILHIPESVTAIPPYAFAQRDDIKKVIFDSDSSTLSIGECAFWRCKNLKFIYLPQSIESIEEAAFQECSSLQNISLPEKVTILPDYCFAWCESLQSVEMPGVRDIKKLSLAYCTNLSAATFSNSITHIGLCAFTHCSSLKEITLPASISELESYAFSECGSLQRVSLPANDSLLGELIFSGCRSLSQIYELSPTPPPFDCNSYPFEPDETALYNNCIIIVPPGAIIKYKNAIPWNMFTTIVENN